MFVAFKRQNKHGVKKLVHTIFTEMGLEGFCYILPHFFYAEDYEFLYGPISIVLKFS